MIDFTIETEIERPPDATDSDRQSARTRAPMPPRGVLTGMSTEPGTPPTLLGRAQDALLPVKSDH